MYFCVVPDLDLFQENLTQHSKFQGKLEKSILNYDFKGYFLKKEYRGIDLTPFSL